MKSIFSKENLKYIENFNDDILSKLNNEFIKTLNNVDKTPRIIGDLTENFLRDIFYNNLPKNLGTFINRKFGRREMADFAFEDNYNNYIIVDVKTHTKYTEFNMPNITSVKRLADFYKNDQNIFSLLIVTYDSMKNNFDNIYFIPIEYLNWSCLTLGSLGNGQIQIANSNIINVDTNNTRKKWMLEFIDVVYNFYEHESEKIIERKKYFKEIRKYWESK